MLTGYLIILPLVIALAVFVLRDERLIKQIALTGSLLEFVLSLFAVYIFLTKCHCNLLITLNWMKEMGVSLAFGVDGISLLMVLLTTFLTPIIILASWDHDYRSPSAFYELILLMEMAFVGVFTAMDGLVFYIFWEMALIPAYFIAALWGGKDRIRITFKFFIYTFIGSLFMLVALIYLYLHTVTPHSFHFYALYGAQISPEARFFIFLAFVVAFGIKIPIFPLHTWQPDTYAESPAGGTMLLSGIMLKMGIYGLIRLVIPICPDPVKEWGIYVMIAAVVGIVYASVIAIRQHDLKRLVAWSSIAHVGLITAGVFALNIQSLQGAVIQMVSHGINIVGLFIVIDIIEKRMGTRDIPSLGGIARSAPVFAAFFMIILLGSIALPLTNGFIGEFMLLLGIFGYDHWIAAFAGLTVILSAVYMLRMYQRVMLGETNEKTVLFKDLTRTEIIILTPIVIMIFWIGLFPGFFLHVTSPVIFELLSAVR